MPKILNWVVAVIVVTALFGGAFTAKKDDGVPTASPDVDLSQVKTAPRPVVVPRSALPPADFRGHAWGSKPTKDMKLVGAPSSEVWGRKSAPEPFLSVPVAEEATLYQNGHLNRGQLYIRGANNFATLRDALTAEYGTPSFENPTLHIYSWSWPGSLIKIKIYLSNDTTTVDIVNQAI